jgi:hypothetical protein
MDRVTKSFVTNFAKSFGFESVTENSVLFEHFTNYTLIEPKTEELFDVEDINIGKDKTIGIDGFALILNRQLINTKEELEGFMLEHKKCSAEVAFIQSKLSKKFDSKEIGNFGFAVNDFIAESQQLKWSDVAIKKIELFNYFVSRISELKENPTCHLYYVTLGINENDKNVIARVNETEDAIRKENLFAKVDFELIGAIELQSKYKKIGQAIERSFEFNRRVTLPVINDVKESYLGVIEASAIIELMTDENGELLPNVFYDNVRDFQGENKVNSEIANTLQSDEKDSFAILNNGITIVAEDLRTTRDNFTITNYQIINGCQTSHVLFENKSLLDDSVKVPIKLVVTENEDLTSGVIRSTNRQTEVKEQDLLAFSNFQKRLEDYYATFKGKNILYYERRSKQFNNRAVERKRIIDKTTQIKALASLFFNKPDMATRYFGTLFSEFGNKLFKDNHEMYPYYIASFSIYKIEQLFRQKKIDSKYRKIKYHILTMFRHEIDRTLCPPFESKRSIPYCENINCVLNDDEKLINVINSVIEKIDSLGFNLEDNEVSKSKDFANKCLEKYRV